MPAAFDADANATRTVDPAAWTAYRAALEQHPHGLTPRSGRDALVALARAREDLAASLRAEPDEVLFTSGGTEANALALWAGCAHHRRGQGLAESLAPAALWLSRLEHRATRTAADSLAARGLAEVTYLPATQAGLVDLARLPLGRSEPPTLVSCLYAHNETGVVQPIEELAARLAKTGTLLHTDAVQAIGRLPFSFADVPVDCASLAGHKLGAVGGIGALLVRRSSPAYGVLQQGAGSLAQAGAQGPLGRAPTSVALAVALGVAARRLKARVEAERALAPVRDAFEGELVASLAAVGQRARVLGQSERRLGNTSLLCLAGVSAETLLIALDLAGFAVSSGAACSAGAKLASHSLQAMGLGEADSQGVVRISLHAGVPDAEQAEALARLRAAIVAFVQSNSRN